MCGGTFLPVTQNGLIKWRFLAYKMRSNRATRSSLPSQPSISYPSSSTSSSIKIMVMDARRVAA
jgi:hypothetical protein